MPSTHPQSERNAGGLLQHKRPTDINRRHFLMSVTGDSRTIAGNGGRAAATAHHRGPIRLSETPLALIRFALFSPLPMALKMQSAKGALHDRRAMPCR